MSSSEPTLVHLANAFLPIKAIHFSGDLPAGRRGFGLVEGRWEGERLQASVREPSADWVLQGEGSSRTSVRMVLETDDGALVFVEYVGRAVRGEGPTRVFAGIGFETSDERYGWLNRVYAIGSGSVHPPSDEHPLGAVEYEVYEVR